MASRMSKKTRSKKTRLNKTRLIIIVALVVVVGAIVGIALSRSSGSSSGVTLHITTWNETSLSTLEGTPVVLNFWASSCGPCRGELPYLDAVAQESGGEIKIVAINVGESTSRIQSFFGDYEPTMILASDRNGEAFVNYCRAYNNAQGYIPFTLFLDSEGIVQHTKIGAFMSEGELRDTLDDVFGITIP